MARRFSASSHNDHGTGINPCVVFYYLFKLEFFGELKNNSVLFSCEKSTKSAHKGARGFDSPRPLMNPPHPKTTQRGAPAPLWILPPVLWLSCLSRQTPEAQLRSATLLKALLSKSRNERYPPQERVSGANGKYYDVLVPQTEQPRKILRSRKTGIPKGLAPGRRFAYFLDEEKVGRRRQNQLSHRSCNPVARRHGSI